MGPVPAARNTLRILTLLSAIDVPVSAARIRTELGLPRSTTYDLLGELERAGFVVHLAEAQTYGLGMAAYSMSAAYATQQPLVRLGERHLRRLAEQAGGSGHLSRLSGEEIVYLCEVRAAGAHALVTQVGVRLHAHRTASGRVMLAMLDDAAAKAICATAGVRGSQWAQLRAQLTRIRADGYAAEVEEVSRGQQSLAVAVRDHVGRPAAALAVTVPGARLAAQERADLLVALPSAAAHLSHKVYATPLG